MSESILDTNKETLRAGNAAVAIGEYEKFLSFCTDNTEWNFVGDRVLKGKEAVLQYMKDTYVVPPVVTVNQLIAEGDFLTAVGEITLKDRKGISTLYSYCDVWRFEKGRMAELRAFVVEISKI